MNELQIDVSRKQYMSFKQVCSVFSQTQMNELQIDVSCGKIVDIRIDWERIHK